MTRRLRRGQSAFRIWASYRNRGNEAIADSVDCLDVARSACIITQHSAYLADTVVQAALIINKGLRIPQLLLNFLTCDDFAVPRRQQHKNLKRLRRKTQDGVEPFQLAIFGIKTKNSKSNYSRTMGPQNSRSFLYPRLYPGEIGRHSIADDALSWP